MEYGAPGSSVDVAENWRVEEDEGEARSVGARLSGTCSSRESVKSGVGDGAD